MSGIVITIPLDGVTIADILQGIVAAKSVGATDDYEVDAVMSEMLNPVALEITIPGRET